MVRVHLKYLNSRNMKIKRYISAVKSSKSVQYKLCLILSSGKYCQSVYCSTSKYITNHIPGDLALIIFDKKYKIIDLSFTYWLLIGKYYYRPTIIIPCIYEIKYTKILEVNLFAFAYRLFRKILYKRGSYPTFYFDTSFR